MNLQPNGSLTALEDINGLIVEGGAHNKAAREVFAGSDIIMTASWNATVELYEYHRELADGRGHECGESACCHLSFQPLCCQGMRCYYASKAARCIAAGSGGNISTVLHSLPGSSE